MRPAILFIVVALAASGCANTDCGTGTVDQNGTCVPSNEVYGTAGCGSGTVLQGDQCVPTVLCDPTTTSTEPDPNNPGQMICVGHGGSGVSCDQPLPCPDPASGKQTICGQLYNIEDNSKFQGPNPTGAPCDGTAATGPCALAVNPFDAYAFGMDPTGTQPLMHSSTYIDDCGRFQVRDIATPASPFVGLGFDDAAMANMGPNGVTNTTGVAANSAPDSATDNVEAWIATKATTDMWTGSGGPPVSGGIYVAIFRQHKCDAAAMCSDTQLKADQSGVTITKSGSTVPNNDFYFTPAEVTHTMIDTSATATGANGTGLLTNASVNDMLAWSGTGGLMDPTNCTWESHAAASLPNIVFFQVFRPKNQIGHTCAQ